MRRSARAIACSGDSPEFILGIVPNVVGAACAWGRPTRCRRQVVCGLEESSDSRSEKGCGFGSGSRSRANTHARGRVQARVTCVARAAQRAPSFHTLHRNARLPVVFMNPMDSRDKRSRINFERWILDLYAKKRTLLGPRKLLFSTAISAACNELSSSSVVIGSILLPVVCRRYLLSALCRPLKKMATRATVPAWVGTPLLSTLPLRWSALSAPSLPRCCHGVRER